MTVSAQTPINRSTGNGVTTVFPYTFKIIADADIEVTVDDVVKTLNVDYTVSGAGVDAGGNVTMTVAPANATSVVRRRNMALVRSTDYQDQGELPATTLDNDIDATVLMVQQLDERLDRTFSLPASFSGDSTLPAPEPGYLIGWDATGENLTNIEATTGTSLVDLAASSGSSLVGFIQAGTGAVATTVQAKLRESFSVLDFYANGVSGPAVDPTGGVDSTAGIQAAINAAATLKKTLHVPAGTYKLIPATVIDDEDTSYLTYAAFLMRSDMHIEAELGAVFKIADGVSSDVAPKSMGVFCTDVALSNVSIKGLTIDMNGANNPISPLRPVTYRRYNQSPILVSGKPALPAAYMDDVLIQNCTFKNNPGVCDIVMAQSNTAGVGIGRRWKVLNNRFLNNGLDTDDHTAVFAWADDVEFSGNIVLNTTNPHTVGLTGGNTCYEIHGNRHRITNNLFYKYYRGIWVSSNLTDSEVQDSIISGNHFFCTFYGVDFFRTVSGLGKSSGTTISGNTFRFDPYTFAAPVPQQKCAVNIASEYEQGNVLIEGNTGTSTDDVVGTVFLTVAPQTVASQPHGEIVCIGNKIKGFLSLAIIATNATNGSNYVAIKNNQYIEPLTSPTFTVGIGVVVKPTGTIKTLAVCDNDWVDDRGTSKISYGVYIEAGSIDYLLYSPGVRKNILIKEYLEAGAVTFTTKDGDFDKAQFTPVWKTGGVAVTLGDGSQLAYYSQKGSQVTVTARLTIGATTVLTAGSISLDLPFTSTITGLQYMGNSRIFDASASLFYLGICEIDGTGTSMTLQINGGTFATTTNPITLATGDVISVQITYNK